MVKKRKNKVNYNVREKVSTLDWKTRGYFAKFFGYMIIVIGIIYSLYRLIFLNISLIEFISIISVTIIFGGLCLLISWIFLPNRAENK